MPPFDIEVARTTFAAGEVSPELYARDDLAKAQTGVMFLENMVVLLEGGVTRRPGTQMVLPLSAAHAYIGIPFRFSGGASNAYGIVIGNGVAQFLLGNAVVVIGGGNNNPYTVAVPYTDADLGGAGAPAAGVANLRYAASGNIVFLFCDGYAPRTLTREADNSWALANFIVQPANPPPQGGCLAPVATENLDPAETIGVSAVSGAITLTASAAFAGAGATVPNGFQQGHVGSVWRLDESALSLTPEWQADEAISLLTGNASLSAAFGNMTNDAKAIDTTLTDYATSVAAAGYVGGAKTSSPIVSVALHCATGFSSAGAADLISFSLYGKNGVPASGTDGVLLGTGAAAGNATDIVINSNDAITNYTDVMVSWSNSVAGATVSLHMTVAISIGAAVLRRYNGNVYQALNAGNAGANPPVHVTGEVLSGQGGVNWLYVHRDRGFVLITAVTDSQHASATVLERLPDSVLAQATANWWPSAWDGVQGWPDRVAVIGNKLRTGRKNQFWDTQPNTFNNFDITDPTSAQSAIYGTIVSPSGSLAWIEAFFQGAYGAFLTRDEEWVVVGQDPFAAITIQNLNPYPARQNGSAQHIPAACEGGIAAISRARDRLMFYELAFNGIMPSVADQELSKSARHILGRMGGGALGCARQQDPNRITWLWCRNGLLAGNTLMKEEQINGWHRHPQNAATASAVNYVFTIPSNDEDVSWTYLITTRTLNGVPAKFAELLQPFFQPANPLAPDAGGAWFLDCALSYSGAATQQLGGLNHLAGCQVNVHADGCMMFDPNNLPTVAANGTLALPRPTQNAVAGLPIAYRVRTLPLDLSTLRGSTAGARQKANHVILRVVNSAGGNIIVNPDESGYDLAEPLKLQHGADLIYGDAVPLKTGVHRPPALDAAIADELIVEVFGSDTMPFTLSGIDPDIIVEETASPAGAGAYQR